MLRNLLLLVLQAPTARFSKSQLEYPSLRAQARLRRTFAHSFTAASNVCSQLVLDRGLVDTGQDVHIGIARCSACWLYKGRESRIMRPCTCVGTVSRNSIRDSAWCLMLVVFGLAFQGYSPVFPTMGSDMVTWTPSPCALYWSFHERSLAWIESHAYYANRETAVLRSCLRANRY